MRQPPGPVLQSCVAAEVEVNLGHSTTVHWEPGKESRVGSADPHYLFPSARAAPTMGNVQERPSETIDRERKRLVETLQADSGLLLDALVARGVLTGPEYEALDALPDAERRVRRLLLLVQSKGEAACQELLRCAQQTVSAPDPAWDWQHVSPGECAWGVASVRSRAWPGVEQRLNGGRSVSLPRKKLSVCRGNRRGKIGPEG